MQPTAYQPAIDHLPLGAEVIMVVGCGSAPVTHGGPHVIPLGHPVTHANVVIPLANAYTMDINVNQSPHREGSFWIADHTEDLPGNRFQYIYFENLPGPLFANRGWCLTAAKSARRLLAPGGIVIIRSGLGATNPGSILHQALVDVFGIAQVLVNVDQYGVPQDLRAMK